MLLILTVTNCQCCNRIESYQALSLNRLASTRQSRLTISATPSRARTRGRAGGRLNPDIVGQRITTNGVDGPTVAVLVATDTGKERRHARRRGKVLTGITTDVPAVRLPKWANAWNQNAQVSLN